MAHAMNNQRRDRLCKTGAGEAGNVRRGRARVWRLGEGSKRPGN